MDLFRWENVDPPWGVGGCPAETRDLRVFRPKTRDLRIWEILEDLGAALH